MAAEKLIISRVSTKAPSVRVTKFALNEQTSMEERVILVQASVMGHSSTFGITPEQARELHQEVSRDAALLFYHYMGIANDRPDYAQFQDETVADVLGQEVVAVASARQELETAQWLMMDEATSSSRVTRDIHLGKAYITRDQPAAA